LKLDDDRIPYIIRAKERSENGGRRILAVMDKG